MGPVRAGIGRFRGALGGHSNRLAAPIRELVASVPWRYRHLTVELAYDTGWKPVRHPMPDMSPGSLRRSSGDCRAFRIGVARIRPADDQTLRWRPGSGGSGFPTGEIWPRVGPRKSDTNWAGSWVGAIAAARAAGVRWSDPSSRRGGRLS